MATSIPRLEGWPEGLPEVSQPLSGHSGAITGFSGRCLPESPTPFSPVRPQFDAHVSKVHTSDWGVSEDGTCLKAEKIGFKGMGTACGDFSLRVVHLSAVAHLATAR